MHKETVCLDAYCFFACGEEGMLDVDGDGGGGWATS